MLVPLHRPRQAQSQAQAQPQPQPHLVGFHHAGGSSLLFREWPDDLPPGWRVDAVELPGRGRRFGEPLLQEMSAAVDAIADDIAESAGPEEQPLVLFGHSMGARLAYEVAAALMGRGIGVDLLVASSHAAPGCPSERDDARDWHLLDDDALVEVLRDLGGSPPGVLESPEMRDIFLPILRADLRMLADAPPLEVALDADVLAVAGRDEELSDEALRGWGACTRGRFEARRLPGGHFYLLEQRPALARLIEVHLRASA